ncbi:MAG: FAD-binding oxidoreductase [Bacteroidia bacterium]|nr:FAD-binding oxidoreductase [Bacteroidia bacterium]
MLHARPQWGARDSLGGLLLRNCGYVDTQTYVEAVAKWITQHNILRRDEFRYDKVDLHASHVTYDGCKARAIIFCEGAGARNNPWFSWLPIRPLTGEVLLIQADKPFEVILNRGVYVVPSGGGQYCVGSTYRHGAAEGPTDEGRRELDTKLMELTTVNYRVTGQRSGVRPTTPDRKPLVGRHPDHACLWVFNGLGTKGISLAPYFSNYLVNCLENEVLVNNAVDISRYK